MYFPSTLYVLLYFSGVSRGLKSCLPLGGFGDPPALSGLADQSGFGGGSGLLALPPVLPGLCPAPGVFGALLVFAVHWGRPNWSCSEPSGTTPDSSSRSTRSGVATPTGSRNGSGAASPPAG